VIAAARRGRRERRGRRARDQRGLTLIELMVSITISALIMAVLASAAIMFFQHSSDNNNSYDDQSSIQNIESLFTGDAQSATAVTLNDTTTQCGTNNTAIVTFSWADEGNATTASWTVEQSAGIRTLVRRQCTNGTPIQRTDVAGVTGTPTITCTPACATFTSVTIGGIAQHGTNFGVTGTRRVTTT
jgi:prepilin-type N-terminal cleavage/methylation domain-containing protein